MMLRPRFVRLALIVACLIAILVAASPDSFAAATVVMNNVDPPGVGFNDLTPAEPVGENPGTTLGEQRRIVFQLAADLWGSILHSDVEIVIQATFRPLPCSVETAVLGSTGSTRVLANFTGAAFADTWYQPALANRLAGLDLTPGPPDPGLLQEPFNDDMFILFNAAPDSDPACLDGRGWYYGLDHESGPDLDLLNVMMHEFAHGLGFANFITEDDGTGPEGLPDVFSMFTLDNSTGKPWNEMTAEERVASAANTGRVVWSGDHVRAQAPHVLGPRPVLEVSAPAEVTGIYEVQPATFGPALALEGLSGELLLADDGVGATADACEPLVGNYTGVVALAERGSCAFTTKAAHAQSAGAVGLVVFNNVAVGLPPMGGNDSSILIPSVGISQEVGGALIAELPGVLGVIGLNPTLLAGADDADRVRLFAESPSSIGSAISHWDLSATPDLLLEPVVFSDVRSSDTVDLTSRLLADVGWDECPSSDFSPGVVIGTCDTGVANQVMHNGCTILDALRDCADGESFDRRCVNATTQVLVDEGVLENRDKNAIRGCTVKIKPGKKPPRGGRLRSGGPPLGRGRSRP